MEVFRVACPLVPSVSHLLSGSCSSPRIFASRFLRTPPHGDALALLLSFASTWLDRGLSPPSIETCPAHTPPDHLPRPKRIFTYSFQTSAWPQLSEMGLLACWSGSI